MLFQLLPYDAIQHGPGQRLGYNNHLAQDAPYWYLTVDRAGGGDPSCVFVSESC